LQEFTVPLGDLGKKVQAFTMEIGMKGMQNPDEVGAAAVDYLRVVGHMVYAYFFARMAKIELVVIDEETRMREFRKELQWSAAYHRLAERL
jgi:hypothetical protein